MKKLIPIMLVCCLLAVPAAGAAGIERNETVYVSLDNAGQPLDIRVVTWLRGETDQPDWVDYGSYDQVTNSVSDLQPNLGSGTITWPAAALQGEGLFYEGSTSRELPIELTISYFLDGKQVDPEELAGQSGQLRIGIKVKNKLRHERVLTYLDYAQRQQRSKQTLYTPLVVQVNLSLPVGTWSDIQAPDANQVLVGNQLRVSWALFPYPDAELTLKMRGNDISLAPIEISALPMMPPMPDLGAASQLTSLVDGLKQIDGSLQQLDTAAGALADGQIQLSSGMTQLVGGLGQVNQGLQSAQVGAESLATGLTQLQAAHQQLVQSANALLQSGDQRLVSLAQGLLAEQQAIEQLVAGGQAMSAGLGASTTGLDTLAEQAKGLLPAGEQLATGQQSLAEGLSALRLQGIVQMQTEAAGQYSAAQLGLAMSAEMQKLVDNQHSFTDNIHNQVGKVQYLMRTAGVELPKTSKPVAPPAPKLSLWQRIVRFFGGK